MFQMISTHFTAPPSVPLTSIFLKPWGFKRSSTVELWDFDLTYMAAYELFKPSDTE